MYRNIVMQLRKKKFRLLSRWKQRLEEAFPLETTDQPRPSPLLLFRTFEECLRQLPENSGQVHLWTREHSQEPDKPTLPEDQRWWQIHLIGEEVVADYVLHDPGLRDKHSPELLLNFLNQLFHTWHNLILQHVRINPSPIDLTRQEKLTPEIQPVSR